MFYETNTKNIIIGGLVKRRIKIRKQKSEAISCQRKAKERERLKGDRMKEIFKAKTERRKGCKIEREKYR
jgi:hypothetical protein